LRRRLRVGAESDALHTTDDDETDPAH
jgi:hypothetical protein